MLLSQSPNNRLLSIASEEGHVPKVRSARAKRYGAKFASGFLEFYKQSEMADCTVVGPDGREYHLHSLLLAYHSEFFRRALTSDFQEGQAKRIVLRFEDAGEIWPTLIEYFYTEEILLTDANVLALFAASRELIIPAIQDFCADFAQSSLEASNAIQFLSQAVQYNCDQFRASCVTLVAHSFDTCCFKPTDGLPVEVILEILDHPQLYVQTEEQVLLFVLNYVQKHQLDEPTVRALFSAVRLPFLSNERLAALALEGQRSGYGAAAAAAGGCSAVCEPRDVGREGGGCYQGPPADMLCAAMAQRLHLLDRPDRLPPPTGGGSGGGGGGGGGGSVIVGGGGGGIGLSPLGGGVGSWAAGDGRSSPNVLSSSSILSGEGVPSSGSDGIAAAAGGTAGGSGGGPPSGIRAVSGLAAGQGQGPAASLGASGGGGSGLVGPLSGLGSRNNAAAGSAGGVVAPRKTYCCSVEYGLPGGSEYVAIPMEQVWEDLAANLTVRVSGDTVEGDPDSVLRTTADDTASWFTVTGEDPHRPVWVEVVFPPHMRVVELTKYTFSHGMNMIAHMFPYGISDSSWFQMKGLSTQVSPGGEDDGSFTSLRTQDSCSQHTEFVVTVDPGCAKQVVWRRLRILAGEDNAQQVRLSIRRLKLYGRVEVSLLREPEGRDVVAAWRRRKEAAASSSGARTYTMLRGLSAKRLDHF